MENKINVALNKDLRKKYGIRSFPVATGDVVTIMSGSRKGEGGKVIKVNHRFRTISVDGITIAKADAKQEEFFLPANILRITRLDFSNPGRLQKVKDLAARKNIVVEEEAPAPEPEPEIEEAEAEGAEASESAGEETDEESEEEAEGEEDKEELPEEESDEETSEEEKK